MKSHDRFLCNIRSLSKYSKIYASKIVLNYKYAFIEVISSQRIRRLLENQSFEAIRLIMKSNSKARFKQPLEGLGIEGLEIEGWE